MSDDILADICTRLTQRVDFEVTYIDETNEGQLATLHYNNHVYYIFLFQKKESRNACFQSFPTTLLKSLNDNDSAGVFCYFLPIPQNEIPRIETDYFKFMYRLMMTVGTNFINAEILAHHIAPYNTVEDIILGKNNIRGNNRANKSTYITKSSNEIIQIFGKLYGANKYETVLICYALNEVTNNQIKVYEIKEGNLQKLPEPSRSKLISLGIDIETVSLTIERSYFEEDNENLRSPRYNYNLLAKYGDKKCALCECEIPEIIQGAHIWPVADIKRENELSQDEKLAFAIDGDNGLWLCNNHHKLLDSHIIKIFEDNSVKYKSSLNVSQSNYLSKITTNNRLPENIVNESMAEYIVKRNRNIPVEEYADFIN